MTPPAQRVGDLRLPPRPDPPQTRVDLVIVSMPLSFLVGILASLSTREPDAERVAQAQHFAVERDGFQRAMRNVQECHARRLVNTARLHPDETVLY